MSFIVSKISFIYKLDQALEKQVGRSEAFTKRTFAVILLILVVISSQNRCQWKLAVYGIIVQGSKLQLYIVSPYKMFQDFNESSISLWHIHSLDIKDLHDEFHAVSGDKN